MTRVLSVPAAWRVLAACIVLAGAAPLHAKDAGGDRPGRAAFERAEANFNLGKFEQARADYQAAYDAEPLPAFLFNIAQCYRNLGDYERAHFFYHRYLVLDPDSPNRAAAERLVAEMGRLAEEQRERERREPPRLAAPAPAFGPGPLVQAAKPPDKPPLYRRAWFWVGLGGVVAVAAGVALAGAPDPARGTLPTIDAR